MKNYMKPFLLTSPAALFALALVSCDVEKVEEGELPEVKVEGETKLPKYDVDGPDVDVGTKKVEVEVPTVDIDAPDDNDDVDDE